MEGCLRYAAFMFICFLVNEVSSECDSWMTVSIDRKVHKQGFHREIDSNVSWVIDNYDSKMKCVLILVYHIPREMFVDLDEIRSQNASQIVPVGDASDFDVEYPAHLSTEQHVLVYPNIKKQHINSYIWLTSITSLPVHWRYQQPTEEEYYLTVTLPTPTILAKCQDIFIPERMQQCLKKLESVQYPCSYDTPEMCEWFVLKQKNGQNNEILFAVPVGIKKHTYLVACGTIFITISASYILMQLPWFDVNKAKIR